MVPTILLISFVILCVVGFVFNRWIAGMKVPSKGKKFQAKRHK